MAFAAEVDRFQASWMSPFELVDLTPHSEVATWGVVLDDGNVLRSTSQHAYAIVARVHGQEHCLPTLPWARSAAQEFLGQQSEERGAWLLRLQPDSPPWLVRGAEPLLARPLIEGRVALLMDYGKVLCDFDYAWLHDAYRDHFGLEIPAEGAERVQRLRPAFEAGQIEADAFFTEVRTELGLIAADRDTFWVAWAGILRPLPPMIALTRHAAGQAGWAVTMVSNIDPILVAHSREVFGLSDLFEHGVFSYQEGVQPKYQDGSMWHRARSLTELRLGDPADVVVATDDTEVNLVHARESGVVDHCIQFRDPWQWQYQLGRLGVYLPRSRMTISAIA